MQRLALTCLLLTAACHAPASTAAVPASSNVKLVGIDSVVSCAEWTRRAAAKPDLDVERVPEPIAYDPPPIPKRLPKGVVGRDGSAEVRIRVLVDTLGKADMKTFTVVKSTSTWLTQNVRTAVAKWKFRPAEVGGCKVTRNYNWGAVAGKKKTT